MTGKRSVRTWIEIDRRALAHNLDWFRKRAGTRQLMAVVKSNAYGHGLMLVARILRSHRDLWFGADSIVEGLRLRREGIAQPILVLGYTLPVRFGDAARNNIILTISHFENLAALARMRSRPRFHLKFDTGMHRQGFQLADMSRLVVALHTNRLAPEGAYSHFAAADNRSFSQKQINIFAAMAGELARAGINSGITHIAATGGLLQRSKVPLGMARLGIGLYGYAPDAATKRRLKPVLQWKTIVAEVKCTLKGERIGYDLTERFGRNSRVAILPIGYWHGFDRGLSGIGEVLIRSRRARVLGRVSMDMTAADVTDIPGVRIGDEVVLIGKQGTQRISGHDMAQKTGTTAYEVLTRLNPLILRIPV